MRIEIHCPHCNTKYLLDEGAVPPQGANLTCKSCGHRWQTRRVDALRAEGGAEAAGAGRGAAAPAAGPSAGGAPAAGETLVTCPGCGLRFVTASASPPPAAISGVTAAQNAALPPRRGQKTILVVEDVDYFTNLARETLGSKYRTITVGTVADARKVLARERVDLLVLDLTLQEGEDGRDILRSLERKEFPVLIFTARDENDMYGEVWEELRRLGADDMLIKGLNVEENLLQKVGTLLGARR